MKCMLIISNLSIREMNGPRCKGFVKTLTTWFSNFMGMISFACTLNRVTVHLYIFCSFVKTVENQVGERSLSQRCVPSVMWSLVDSLEYRLCVFNEKVLEKIQQPLWFTCRVCQDSIFCSGGGTRHEWLFLHFPANQVVSKKECKIGCWSFCSGTCFPIGICESCQCKRWVIMKEKTFWRFIFYVTEYAYSCQHVCICWCCQVLA